MFTIGEGDFEKAVKKFNRDVGRSGILQEVAKRKCYEKPSAIRRKKLRRRELFERERKERGGVSRERR